MNIFRWSGTPGGPGGGSVAPWVAAGVAIHFAITELSQKHFNPIAAAGAAGFEASPLGFVKAVRSQATLCTGACSFGRTLGDAAGTAAGAYVDYTKGKVVGIVETVEEVGGAALDNAWQMRYGPVFLVAENLYNAPDTVRNLARGGQAVAEAATSDPWGTVKQVACRSDGCGFDDYSRNEYKLAAIVYGPDVAAKAAVLAEDTVKAVARIARRMKAPRIPTNRVGAPYPQVQNPGTGELIPHPGEGLTAVPKVERVGRVSIVV
jgi:hypothetical protein